MQPAPNVAVRRFRTVQLVAAAVKVAAIVGLLLFVGFYYGVL
jgi:L-asparagine transporter-like permease